MSYQGLYTYDRQAVRLRFDFIQEQEKQELISGFNSMQDNFVCTVFCRAVHCSSFCSEGEELCILLEACVYNHLAKKSVILSMALHHCD